MNNKLYLLIPVLIIGVLLAVGGYFLLRPQKVNTALTKKSEPPVSDVLFFTNPVTEFGGKVDKISGSTIYISGKYAITYPPIPPYAPTSAPGQTITVPPLPPSKVFTYKVNITSHTAISKPDTTVAYLIKKITPVPTPKFTIKDIKVGQLVTVTTFDDLRTLKSDEFDASTLRLPPVINTISGKITNINTKDGIITLKAIPPYQTSEHQPTPVKKVETETEYAISVTADTEISRLVQIEGGKLGATPKPPEPLSYQISDLAKDMQVTVFVETDVLENTKLKALRIEPPADLVPASLIPTKQPTPSAKP